MPTIKLNNDLTITLKGINYQDLRNILTAASIHHYETEKENEAKVPEFTESWLREQEIENIAAEKQWCSDLRILIDNLESQIQAQINKYNHKRRSR